MDSKDAASPATPSSAASTGQNPAAVVDTRVYTIVGEEMLRIFASEVAWHSEFGTSVHSLGMLHMLLRSCSTGNVGVDCSATAALMSYPPQDRANCLLQRPSTLHSWPRPLCALSPCLSSAASQGIGLRAKAVQTRFRHSLDPFVLCDHRSACRRAIGGSDGGLGAAAPAAAAGPPQAARWHPAGATGSPLSASKLP